jgi:hypothetical protein
MIQPAQKPPSEPVEFAIAGTRFTAHPDGRVQGTFHPIPPDLWQAIIGFHRQCSINLNAESVSYHRWCPAEERYHTLIPWQTTTKHGLAVNVSWTDPRNAALLEQYALQYKAEFFPCNTIHTHVDTNAFESGTDARDEKETAGWHITLGHLVSKPKYDLDFRMRLPALKKIKDLLNIHNAVKLTWKHLFVQTPEIDHLIHHCPGTTDFHHHLERVIAR